jgi:hypothetical protein
MNRKKKINQIFKKKAKAARAKLNPNKSERYISKAERAKTVDRADASKVIASE